MANKIISVASVKNDADIIESAVRHALKFSDEVLIQDRGSIDETREILENLKRENLPIRILDETIDGLIKSALDSQANIVIPFRADEFLILMHGNNSDAIRSVMQNLKTDRIYTVSRIPARFVKPEENQDQFALNREIVQSRNLSGLTRTLIIGAEAWKSKNLQSIEKIPDGSIFIADLSMFCFDERSEGQQKSRDMISQIEEILGQKTQDPPAPIQDPIPATLAPYKNEVTLKFTRRSVDPLQNIFKLAQNLANQNRHDQTVESKKIVRVFIFHSGDSTRTIRSIDSVRAQDYPHKKIFVVVLKPESMEKVFEAEKKFLAQIKFIEKTNFEKILGESGDYVQFVTAGDVLKPERLSKMVALMNSEEQLQIAFSESTLPEKNFVANYMSIRYPKSRGKKQNLTISKGEEIFEKLLETGFAIPAGISRAFFRNNFFNDRKWLEMWLLTNDVESRQMVLWNSMLNATIGYFDEVLIESGAEVWNLENLNSYLSLWLNEMDHFKNSKYLSAEKYQTAKRNFDSAVARARR